MSVQRRGRPVVCGGCGVRPAAFTVPRVDVCFECLPGGPHTPPPCLVCGRSGFFFHQGLCTACHPLSPERRGSCPDCFAWGTSRAAQWRCWGCVGWHYKFSKVGPGGPCTWCRRTVAVNHDRVCRMCWQQRARLRRTSGDGHLPYDAALGCGWVQLSFASTRAQERRPERTPPTAPQGAPPPLVPHAHRQLTLFEPPPRTLAACDGVARDPVLAGWLEHSLNAWAAARGWSCSTLTRYRRGLRIVLAVQDTPGGPVPASVVQELTGSGMAARLLHEFLAAHGFLEEDRPQTIEAWFARTTAHLPEPMTGQLAHWFTARLNGQSTSPRSLALSPITLRLHVHFALPVLTRLAAADLNDLTDVPPARLREELAACRLTGNDYANTASALRAVFGFLHTHRYAVRNPAVHLRVGRSHRDVPVPAELAPLREALTSPDPVRAAVTALLVFHAPRVAEIRTLTLTDLRDLDQGRLYLPSRTILLADPVKERLAAYLTHRHTTWPRTANPHLLLTHRSAVTTTPVSAPWLYQQYPSSSHLLRNDRMVNEAQAAADARMISELFGITVVAATRYTRPYADAARAQPEHPRPGPAP
ncbi:site-specific integrase [Streptomyces sp. E2N166]|uniref:site-specific integrase n=1 Tax=Streptomyces sp. E2N166 TaxID=1851909 RepID=UPI001292A5C4|nr:site-specific integrase [Streptomyces sp. E2N166]